MILSELLKQVGIENALYGEKDPQILGLSINATQIQKGEAFVALKGALHDGVDFIPEAEEKGAVAVLAERPVPANVPVVVVPQLRRILSQLAAVMYPSSSLLKVAVTGTNGKTSTVFYVQQLLNQLGICAASLGTIGVESPVLHQEGTMTTPDAIRLNKTLQTLEQKGVQVVAMEASSHGLDQGRLDGLTMTAGAFTNLTQDHLDYHKTMEAYFEAKSNLFKTYLGQGKTAVLNADIPEFEALKEIALKKGERVISYGWNTEADFRIIKQTPTESGQDVSLLMMGKEYHMHIDIVGDFQIMNIFAAIGLCLGAGADLNQVMALLPTLKAPAGRLESMGGLPNGSQVYVDYAHTPDAIERILLSLRPHTKGRLLCLMGCGGNRDKTKRPLMGALASKLADVVYVTDDNPRNEDPAVIRSEILQACPEGIECRDRETAIWRAVSDLRKNDVLVLAGKGHENGQTIKGITYAFDDRVEAKLALLRRMREPIWEAIDLRLALSADVSDLIAGYGVSIDTRTLKLGDIFIALKGEQSDGHHFVHQAVEKGASVCIVDHLVDQVPAVKQIVVSDTMVALESLARFSRMRSSAQFVGVTGSSGKTTTKEMLRHCLSEQGVTYATQGNFNNQIGVPLTLAGMPLDTQYAIIEMGMNHPGELMQLSDIVRPDVSIITMIGAAHRAFFKSNKEIALAKSEIFEYQNRQGTFVLNRDDEFYTFLKERAEQQNLSHQLTFGSNEEADFRLMSVSVEENEMRADVAFKGRRTSLNLRFVGDHFAKDALGILAVIDALGADVPRAIQSLSTMEPASGRGALIPIHLPQKRDITLIDDAYNANPASMAASIRSLGLRLGGRKIAVLGDMMELGPESAAMHAGLATALIEANVDRVYLCGDMMQSLWTVLPQEMKGAHLNSVDDLIDVLKQDLLNGDIVLVKSSHGSHLDRVVAALKKESEALSGKK